MIINARLNVELESSWKNLQTAILFFYSGWVPTDDKDDVGFRLQLPRTSSNRSTPMPFIKLLLAPTARLDSELSWGVPLMKRVPALSRNAHCGYWLATQSAVIKDQYSLGAPGETRDTSHRVSELRFYLNTVMIVIVAQHFKYWLSTTELWSLKTILR